MNKEESKEETSKAEEPKAEEPKAEEPKAEEPKAEEPKAEEPKAEEPKAEEPKAPALKNSLVGKIEEFRPGDTVIVNIRIKEGDRERIQAFQGNVIKGRFNNLRSPSIESTFTVRRISSGIGVERIFPYFSSVIDSLKVTRRGKVRQGKLYYLRGRTGKSARIKERR